MTPYKNYTFIIPAKTKTRHIAGPYNIETLSPKYEIKLDCPSHVKNQIDVNQYLHGSPPKCQWAWEINNKSTWKIWVTIIKDGIIQK